MKLKGKLIEPKISRYYVTGSIEENIKNDALKDILQIIKQGGKNALLNNKDLKNFAENMLLKFKEQEYLNQMDKEGAYLLEDDEKAVIVIIGEFERNYYSDVKLIDNDIVLNYNNESFDNSKNLICKDVYLINNINKNSTIKLYHNEKEDCFVKVIACEL